MKNNIYKFKLSDEQHDNLLKAMKTSATLLNESDFLELLILKNVKRTIDYDTKTKFNYIFRFDNKESDLIQTAMELYYGADKMDTTEFECRFNESDFLREIISDAVDYINYEQETKDDAKQFLKDWAHLNLKKQEVK